MIGGCTFRPYGLFRGDKNSILSGVVEDWWNLEKVAPVV